MPANDTILGLPTSAKLAAMQQRFFSWRREVVHSYPTGNAPLTAIMSMIPSEVAEDSMINWFEKRYQSPTALLRGTNPLTKTAPTNGDSDTGTVADTPSVIVAGATHFLKVDSTRLFRPGYVIQMLDVAGTEHQVWVRDVVPGVADPTLNGYLIVTFLRPPVAYVPTAFATGVQAAGVGIAIGEAASGTGITPLGTILPYTVSNQTQILRTPFHFSGTALQEGLKFDATGPYREGAKNAVIEHMTMIERAILFGKRSTTTQAAFNAGGVPVVVRTMSGIFEFLRLWDAGSAGITIDGAIYAPYSFKGPSVTDADDMKRMITNSDGKLTIDRMHGWFERVSRFSTNRTNQKLILCGNGAALAFTKMFRKESQFAATTQMNIYGVTVNTIHTPFGDYHLMTHPMFNESPYFRNTALILDVWNLRFRPLANRDTTLRTNCQNNGDDFRLDEYRTECTLEFTNPDSCMFIQNIRDYAVS